MKRKNYNILLIIIGILVVGVIGLTVAYAALSTTLNVQFGNLTQSALTWDVGFNTGSVAGVATGSGVSCGTVTVNSTTVSGAKVKFGNSGDKCSYTFTVRNNGTLGASITSITPKKPTSTTCGTASGSTMVCGDITYKLRYDSATSTTQPAVGNVLAAKSGTTATKRTVVLTAEYTGATSAANDFSQSSFGFTIVYGQH